ncbi:unnamed protein product [Spodoptera littoralis]|uniref:Uncharacterized protein n=1 Tax=Spodoptera littoralis TaxID=7109 RepID=A0A9P0I1G3_SPOLI|nr:unnamed protein product [Spodoptera littoralis]CAH1638054.1 unnamed protein product [Spodoptera littoralis]
MLEPSKDLEFYSDISKQVKEFYESVVIFLTNKDYSDLIFNALCSIRTALREDDKKRLIDTIVDIHLQWLHAVNEIENFKNGLSQSIPREEVFQSITFTIDAIGHRLKYFQRYMEKYRGELSNEYQVHVLADLEIVEEMNKEVTVALLEKLKKFKSYDCFEEYKVHIHEAIDDLLNWLDKNYDGLVIKLSKYINVHLPNLQGDLTKTLQQIVDEFNTDPTNPVVKEVIEELRKKGREIGFMIRGTVGHSLELSKVYEKIINLEGRIERLENEPTSAAVMALKRKKEFLEKRVASLEKMKTTLKSVQNLTEIKLHGDFGEEDEICSCEDFYQLKIFNHFLPMETRERLVTELCYLWDLAVFGERSNHSIISILSATEVKEEFTDEKGTFYVDEHSRRIYKSPIDGTLLQPNERGELVPLSDDENHIYYYDECGRYFVEPKTRERIYKAHATASEYMMDSTGLLIKIKEERDGIVFHYDNWGRYYVNEEGKHIYRDEDHLSEYENDGLGNLVRIRSQADIFQSCPGDAQVSEDFKYLKQTVGPALRFCIAEVIIHQPADPIKYLSSSLIKFRENIELKEKRITEKQELEAEREFIAAEERAKAEREAMALLATRGGSEASYDTNLIMYSTIRPDDQVLVKASDIENN